jgi:hypothetical protein
MTTMDCSEAMPLLDELALDVLPGDRRAALLAHLEECPACRDLLDELSETADALLSAAPVATPPAGFEDRVLERMQGPRVGGDVGGGRGARTAGPAPARLRLLAVAAAAAVLLAVGGVAGARLGRSSGGGHELATVQLISATGAGIGDVSTYGGERSWFFMRLEGPLPNGVYQCVVDTDDGRTVPIGKLWAWNGHGGWGEHVALDLRHVKAARMLDDSGATVATARLR